MDIKFLGVPNNLDYSNANSQGAPMNTGPSKVVPGMEASTPAQNLQPTPPAQGASPLDKYVDLFNNTPTANSQQPGSTTTPVKPTPTILDGNRDIFSKAFEGVNFAGTIAQDKLAVMAKGGTEGLAAMMEVINNAARNAAAVASETSISVARKATEVGRNEMDLEMKRAITLNGSNDLIRQQNELLLNPAYAPLVATMQQVLLNKNPEMSAQDLAKNTVEYFQLMQKPAAPQGSTPAPKDNGIASFLDSL